MGQYKIYGIKNYNEHIHDSDYELRYSVQSNYTLLATGTAAALKTVNVSGYSGVAVFLNEGIALNQILIGSSSIYTDVNHGIVAGNLNNDWNIDPDLTDILGSSDDLSIQSLWFEATGVIIFHTRSSNIITLDIDNFDGTSGNDSIIGDKSSNHINGFSGDDNLKGGSGNDTLIGGLGNDKLDGDSGTDSMLGGSGNDTYFVRESLDTVTEKFGEGIDLTYSYISSYTLSSNVENGRIANITTANITGNSLSNTLFAGTGNNILNGSSTTSTESDTVSYLYGLKTGATVGVTIDLKLTSSQNTISSGSDKLINIEHLTGSNLNDTLIGNKSNNNLYGGLGNDGLTGYLGNDKLIGNAGNDTLIGGAGNDRLIGDLATGGTGLDIFVFNTAINATSNLDTIVDFNPTYDTIKLENTGTGLFNKLTTLGKLAAGNFVSNNAPHALDSNDFILYDKDNGKIYYDADANGIGAAVQITTIGVNLALTNADFIVI